jgi:DNA repair protein RecN (Recombination protein N)
MVLASLSIRNFVLIEDAVLEFEPGLNVLTGETGAGKTLLTRALGLLMGERAEDGLVGQAGPEAVIQAIFQLNRAETEDLPAHVTEMIGPLDSGELIITRRLGREGRNRCYVNDTAVTLALLGSAVGGLLSFAGQHEYRRLLDPSYQLSVLDQWAGADVTELAGEYAAAFRRSREAGRLLEQSRKNEASRRREIELLRFEVGELSAAHLSLEEEAALVSELRLLSRAEEILTSTALAAESLRADGAGDAERPDAAHLVTQAIAHLSGLAGVDPSLDRTLASLTELHYQIVDIARELHSYVDCVSVDPERLETVNTRLRLYMDLGRKYGGSTEAAVKRLAEAKERLESLEFSEDDLVRLEEERAAQAARAVELAQLLGQRRREAAPRLEESVAAQLSDLGMPSAALRIDVRSSYEWQDLHEAGGDAIEFLLVANPGQEPRSLARTASGGELSRVLLGIKCALAGAGGSETLIFDEIDAGIGGRTAVAVANKLRELAQRSQVIVVTHLAQVAASADCHYVIDKLSDPASTVTRLSKAEGENVVTELCRMLGGRPDDLEAMAHARQLRDRAVEGLLD